MLAGRDQRRARCASRRCRKAAEDGDDLGHARSTTDTTGRRETPSRRHRARVIMSARTVPRRRRRSPPRSPSTERPQKPTIMRCAPWRMRGAPSPGGDGAEQESRTTVARSQDFVDAVRATDRRTPRRRGRRGRSRRQRLRASSRGRGERPDQRRAAHDACVRRFRRGRRRGVHWRYLTSNRRDTIRLIGERRCLRKTPDTSGDDTASSRSGPCRG